MAKARSKLERKAAAKSTADDGDLTLYHDCLALRSHPVAMLFAGRGSEWVALTISSINEDKLLTAMGVDRAERYQICLLYTSPSPRDAHES
eukprot:4395543-Prymnesium_polylepis.1